MRFRKKFVIITIALAAPNRLTLNQIEVRYRVRSRRLWFSNLSVRWKEMGNKIAALQRVTWPFHVVS